LPSLRSNRGFTLIELLLAIAISAIVLTITYASFFQVLKSKEFNENELEMYQEARVILSRLTRDFSMAYERGGVFPKSADIMGPYFVGEQGEFGSKVTFTSFSHTMGMNTTASDQAEITYFLRKNPKNGLYFLVRGENPGIGVEGGGVEFPISERVVEFELSYIGGAEGEQGQEPAREWDSSVQGGLPKGVNIRVVMSSPRGERVEFSSTVLIPVAVLGG